MSSGALKPEDDILLQVLQSFPLGIHSSARILVHDTASTASPDNPFSSWASSRGSIPPEIVSADFASQSTRAAWERGTYPFVVINFAITDFSDPLSVLNQVHHVLKADGIAIVTCWKDAEGLGDTGKLADLMDEAGWERGFVKTFEKSAGGRDAWVVLAKKWVEMYG